MFLLLSVTYVCVSFSFFFFKQKTAYEMRISDWSSDVCSSDLSGRAPDQMRPIGLETQFTIHAEGSVLVSFGNTKVLVTASVDEKVQIGRASCRERVCQYV